MTQSLFDKAVREHERITGHNDPEIVGIPGGAALVCHVCRTVLKEKES